MDSLHDAIRNAGMEPPDSIEPGRIHRFPGAGKSDGNRAGWCKLFPDGEGGVFGDWSTGLSETWQAKRDRPMTADEREAFRFRIQEAKAESERERKTQHKKAASKAESVWNKATHAPVDHAYLIKKSIGPHGTREYNGLLIIPLRDGSILHSLQFIASNGDKRFLPGGRVQGCYFSIGKPEHTLCVCEGYATGASIHEATGLPIAVAFTAGNLKPVSEVLCRRRPDIRIIICADNDENGTGQQKAKEAAQSIGGMVAIPPEEGDWNDYAQKYGLESVRERIDCVIDIQPDGAKLLDDTRKFISRFCAFPSAACLDAVTLWAAHAHMVEHFHTSPRLALLSPEPESGKTRVLEILDLLTPESMLIFSPSVAAIFRKLAQDQVTLLFDECDTIFTKRGKDDQNEDLRALLNSGYRKGAHIPRCVGTKHEVQDFKVFAACALAGIGELPDTIMTRAIVIRMRRRAANEQVEQFRSRMHEQPGHELRARLLEWAAMVGPVAGNAWPELPPGITDRRAEAWEPLIAVADQAGGHWPETVRNACIELCRQATDRRISLGLRLLADLRLIFQDRDVLSTNSILAMLCGMDPYKYDAQGEVYIAEDAPWAELRGKPLDSRGLARMLRKYDVTSTKIRQGDKTLQGYRREDLWDAWQRYLSDTPAEVEQAEHVEQASIDAASRVPDKNNVPEQASEVEHRKPAPDKESSGCSACSGLAGETATGEIF